MADTHVRRQQRVRLPSELTNILGVSGAVLAVLVSGSALSAVLPDPNVWQIAASYMAPASLAFAVYWWLAQKL